MLTMMLLTQSTACPQSCEKLLTMLILTTKGYEPNYSSSMAATSTGQCVVCRFPGAEEQTNGEMRADMMDEKFLAARPKEAPDTAPWFLEVCCSGESKLADEFQIKGWRVTRFTEDMPLEGEMAKKISKELNPILVLEVMYQVTGNQEGKMMTRRALVKCLMRFEWRRIREQQPRRQQLHQMNDEVEARTASARVAWAVDADLILLE